MFKRADYTVLPVYQFVCNECGSTMLQEPAKNEKLTDIGNYLIVKIACLNESCQLFNCPSLIRFDTIEVAELI
jgi:hypothetical protein